MECPLGVIFVFTVCDDCWRRRAVPALNSEPEDEHMGASGDDEREDPDADEESATGRAPAAASRAGLGGSTAVGPRTVVSNR